MRSRDDLESMKVEAIGLDADLRADVGDHPLLLHVDEDDEAACALLLQELEASTHVA